MTSSNDFITFGGPDIQDNEIAEVVATLKSGWLGTGPKVKQFESDFATYKEVNSNQVVALNSCTAALHLSFVAAGLKPGDEVITTALTFCATVNAIIHSGATPVLADVERDSFNIDPVSIESKITAKTKAIVPVHFAGSACDMDAIMALAEKYGLKVIEDCAHAIEGRYKGKPLGSFGDFACYSFYVTKNITTGEGGMVVAKDPADSTLVRELSLHGMSKDAWNRFGSGGYKHYAVAQAGFKYNMMDIQAAIGIHQLKRIDKSLTLRQKVWRRYQDAFSALPITLPFEIAAQNKHACHLYTILIDEKMTGLSRDECLDRLTGMGIGVGVHYLSIPEHPYYQTTFDWHPDDYPVAKQIGRSTLSLPLSSKLSESDVSRVISSVKALFADD
jgi:dTDP-4-amino-4,6-dideoxygalactose transaminase